MRQTNEHVKALLRLSIASGALGDESQTTYTQFCTDGRDILYISRKKEVGPLEAMPTPYLSTRKRVHSRAYPSKAAFTG